METFERIDSIFAKQKAYLATEQTRSVAFRKHQLTALEQALLKWDARIAEALWQDLRKSKEEAYLTEMSIVLSEIRTARKKVAKWARREWVKPSLASFPAINYVVKEPLGTALIVAPWNYPMQLLLTPLVGAIAAGCTAVLKPSPYVPHVSEVLAEMIAETFPEEYIALVQGHRDVNKALLDKPFDLIFYTGSPAVGHTVMEAAAKHLTPVVLELGGKSPCIIDRTANVEIAAKRVAWAKTLNSGQICIAPDYVLIHPEVKDAFVEAFKRQLEVLHGADVQQSAHYVRMVSEKAFNRVSAYLSQGKILCGGRVDAADRFIEPTLLDEVALDSPVMQEEIFGPVLPVITLDAPDKSFEDQVVTFVTARPKPLALYYYGKERAGMRVVNRTSSGGACINDCIMHIVNPHAPFGGVGHSGMGRYHHRESFEAFSHRRSVLVQLRNIDLPIRYMPYKLFKYIRRLV